MSADARVQLAGEYLAGVRQHKVGTLPPSVLVRECAELRRQLGLVLDAIGQEPEAGRLAAIRSVLEAFDWERDDRQYALEKIERIAEGPDDAVALTTAQLSTALAALDDAATFRSERAAVYCYDCASHPAGACDVHVDDLDQAGAYRQLATALGGGQ